MQQTLLPIHFTPLQGYTDAAYRQAHARLFGGVERYYTPFVRVEHGECRRRDVRDLEPEYNREVPLIPQLIAPDAETAGRIMPLFVERGYREVDINLGCPFPTLARRHNGAGLLPYPDEVERLLTSLVEGYPEVCFSVKIRLGWEHADEGLALLPLLNTMPLSHLIVHARLGVQQYKGETDIEAFARFYEACRLPLFFNGDLRTVEEMEQMTRRFPRLAGLALGRGLLANPALALEYKEGRHLKGEELARKVRQLHDEVYARYEAQLQGGELQLVTKMKSFWEYLLPDGDRKARKIIHKTSKLANYRAAVSNLLAAL